MGDTVGPRLAPAALRFTIFVFSTGQALAPPVAGKIADLTGSFTPGFILSAAVAFADMAGALMISPPSR